MTTRYVVSGQEAISKVHLSKIRYSDQMVLNPQVLADGTTGGSGPVKAATGVQTTDLGNTPQATLFLRATQAATFAIWHSIDGTTWLHDSQFDIAMVVGTDQVQTITAAPFIKVIPSVDQTAAYIAVMALHQ